MLDLNRAFILQSLVSQILAVNVVTVGRVLQSMVRLRHHALTRAADCHDCGKPCCSALAKVRALIGSDTSRLNTPAPVQPTSVSSWSSRSSFSATFTEAGYSSGQPPRETHPG